MRSKNTPLRLKVIFKNDLDFFPHQYKKFGLEPLNRSWKLKLFVKHSLGLIGWSVDQPAESATSRWMVEDTQSDH